MLYIDSNEKETRQDMIAEIRNNLRNIHNKYIEKQDLAAGEQCLDLFEYCHTENKFLYAKLKPFVDIAVKVEGIEESYADCPINEFKDAVEKIITTLREEMKGV